MNSKINKSNGFSFLVCGFAMMFLVMGCGPNYNHEPDSGIIADSGMDAGYNHEPDSGMDSGVIVIPDAGVDGGVTDPDSGIDPNADSDGDGVIDSEDECDVPGHPELMEDHDGFDDEDGCTDFSVSYGPSQFLGFVDFNPYRHRKAEEFFEGVTYFADFNGMSSWVRSELIDAAVYCAIDYTNSIGPVVSVPNEWPRTEGDYCIDLVGYTYLALKNAPDADKDITGMQGTTCLENWIRVMGFEFGYDTCITNTSLNASCLNNVRGFYNTTFDGPASSACPWPSNIDKPWVE